MEPGGFSIICRRSDWMAALRELTRLLKLCPRRHWKLSTLHLVLRLPYRDRSPRQVDHLAHTWFHPPVTPDWWNRWLSVSLALLHSRSGTAPGLRSGKQRRFCPGCKACWPEALNHRSKTGSLALTGLRWPRRPLPLKCLTMTACRCRLSPGLYRRRSSPEARRSQSATALKTGESSS